MSTPAEAQLTSALPNARLESELLRIYHRALAERLWRRLTTAESHERDFFERTPTIWLHPRACWAARLVDHAPELFARVSPLVWDDLHRSRSVAPDVEVLTSPYDDPWCSTARGCLQDYDRMLGKDYEITMSDLTESQVRGRIEEASALIQQFWPEAYAEQQLILRTVVAVQGGGYMYGSFQNMLGSVFVAQNSLLTVDSTIEMLLHEVGHQSLFIHAAYRAFVRNGGHLVTHPLRSDPRPIAGTVHAAYVLTRLVVGFSKWCQTIGASPAVEARRHQLVEHLTTTLHTLRTHAVWTRDGERLFAQLHAASAPYLSARGGRHHAVA